MTLDEIQSRLHDWVAADQVQDDALGEYLQILKPVPEPHLASGRRRVLAEAARVQPSGAYWTQFFLKTIPRLSLSWALALLLLVGGIASAALSSNSNGAPSFFFGFSSTPTVAWTRAPLYQASATVSLAPTPLSAPASTSALTITPAPAPTPVPTLPFIETAQSQPNN